VSTCEAELIALADCAIKLLYIISLLRLLGHEIDEAIEVYTNNKAAHDLCHRFNSSQNSRHINRKLFKMRELRGLGVVTVARAPTAENPADIFTKVLDKQPFDKHRKFVHNLSGDTGANYACRAKSKLIGARRSGLRRGPVSNISSNNGSSSSRRELTRRWAYSLARAPRGRR